MSSFGGVLSSTFVSSFCAVVFSTFLSSCCLVLSSSFEVSFGVVAVLPLAAEVSSLCLVVSVGSGSAEGCHSQIILSLCLVKERNALVRLK